jgi:CheY-like chemotaxis protein
MKIPKLLIIEDDVTVATIYRNKLTHEGFDVALAADGQVGYDLAVNFQPDVVLLDLMIPTINGVELIQKFRAEEQFKDLPIVVFSNTYMSSLVQEARKAGATKCLSKGGSTPKQIIEVLYEVLKKKMVESVATAEGDPDAAFQADLRKSFSESLPTVLATVRSVLQNLSKAASETERLKQMNELYRRMHALSGNAGITGLMQISQMADALEALLKELQDNPRNINISTMRTVALAVDFLGFLFEKGTYGLQEVVEDATVLVVDDEIISRRALTYALDKAKLKSVAIEDPIEALDLLEEKKFDLIFLDVDMPHMTGFELCSRLRAIPQHQKTPVIFVTGLTDFQSRANSTISGGNDFIAKPFIFMELAVKSLVHVMRLRLEKK